MDLDDRVTIVAPEGVELEFVLAGVGSRFIAGSVDLAIQLVLLLVLALVTGATGGSSGAALVVFIVGAFAIIFFYPVAFEVLARGRTPGKRLSHLRVVRDSGAPVDLPASAIRNLVRVIDGPPLLYLPTLISIAATAHNQRPGDLAAGTLVVREAAGEPDAAVPAPAVSAPSAPPVAWDVSAVSAEEVATVRRFLERRGELEAAPRAQLAARLASGLRAKVTGAPADLTPERFLEGLVARKG